MATTKTVGFTLLAVVAFITIASAGVAAQEVTNRSNTTYAQEVDGNLRVVSYDFDDQGVRLVFEADRSTIVTLSEVTDTDGAGQFAIRRTRLPKGQTEVRFPAPNGLTIVTSDCLRAESCTIIEEDGGLVLLGGPYGRSDVQLAGLTGTVSALSLSAFIAWRKQRTGKDHLERLL